MYHPIDSRYLYCAIKLVITFKDEYTKLHTVFGTGFIVSSEKVAGGGALITNRHVLDAGFKDPRKREWTVEEISLSGYGNSKEYFELTLNDWNPLYSCNWLEDVAAVVIRQAFFNKGEIGFLGAVNCDLDVVADQDYFETLNVGDFLVLPGYPEFHDKNSNRPILRSGIISSDPLHDYAGPGMEVGLRTLAYEAFSTAGASGGPVFALGVGINTGVGLMGGNYRPPRIIGINAGHITFGQNGGHSGISYFYKSSVIRELLKRLA